MVIGSAVLTAAQLSAQSLKAITLAPATGKLDAEFDVMTSVRELRDGSALVTDGGAQQLYVADFAANSATPLGRKGHGPGEWELLTFLYPIGRDSTVMHDIMSRRWLIITGAKISATIPSDHPAVREAGSAIYGGDEQGHVLLKKSAPPRNGDTEFTRKDSNAIALMSRTSGRTDTIARVRVAPHISSMSVDNEGRIHRSIDKSTEANAQEESALLAPDGWLAVVRLEPLRVDWRSPTGQWTKGAALPLQPEVVNARERKLLEQRYEENQKLVKAKLRLPMGPLLIPDKYNVMEPYQGLFIASDGRLVMRRKSTGANPMHRYLVINRRGSIDGQFTLGEMEDIIGFGAKFMYVGAKNDDDIQTLRRHPWP